MKNIYPPMRACILSFLLLLCCLPAFAGAQCAGSYTTYSNFCDLNTIQLEAVPSGGTAPYTYLWETGETTQTILIPQAIGDYMVTISDASGCTTAYNCHIKPNYQVLNYPYNQNSCSGNTVTLFLDWFRDSIAGATYEWSTGETTPTIQIDDDITWSVTVTDPSNGCTFTIPPSFFDFHPTPDPEIIGPATLCPGETATLSASGGPFDQTYWYPPGAYSPTFTVNGPGTYVLYASNNEANYCQGIDTITIADCSTMPCNVDATIKTYDYLCAPGSLVTEQLVPSGGTPPYTYQWSTGATTQSVQLSPTPSSDLYFTVTDAAGCSYANFVHVKLGPYVANLVGNYFLCGDPTATLGLFWYRYPPEGATYLWSTGETSPTIEITTGGNYSVTVTDPSNGCTMGFSVGVAPPDSPIPQIVSVTPAGCGQNNGAIDLSVSGPGNPYSYHWSNGPTTQDISGLAPGTYTVTITGNTGCSTTASATVNSGGSLNLSGTTVPNTSCSSSNGSINLSVAPTGSYTYTWSNGANTQDISGLTGGTYFVTVTSGGGCSATTSFTVANNVTNPTATTTSTPASCNQNNGSVNLTMSPAGAYTFNWSNGLHTEDLSNLAAGTYTVTATNAGGCSVVATATVAGSTGFTATYTTSSNPPWCPGETVTVTAVPQGGTGPYTYHWTDNTTSPTQIVVMNGTFHQYCTITDANGCTAEVLVHIKPPIWSTSFIWPLNGICQGDSALLQVFGSGPGPYSYLWETGETTQGIYITQPDNYSVVITHVPSGCTQTVSADIPLTVQPSAMPEIVAPATLCAGQPATLSVNGGPFQTYSWGPGGQSTPTLAISGPGTYTVTVSNPGQCTGTDVVTVAAGQATPPALDGPASLCGGQSGSLSVTNSSSYTGFHWSTGQTTPTISVTGPGSYTVTVTAAGGCTATGSITVSPDPSAPNPGTAVMPATCGEPTGAVNLNVTPAGAYTFLWSNGQTTEDLADLAAGAYQVTVTGPGGCSAVASATVPNTNPVINLSGSAVPNSSCQAPNGSINLNAGPGSTYTYLWSNGATTQDLANLASGNYTVTVSSGLSCSATTSFTVANNAGGPNATAFAMPATCGQSNGAADLSLSNGSAPFTFLWSNGATTQNLSNIPSGNYSVTVTDANACSSVAAAVVENENLLISLAAVPAPNTICTGGGNGSLDLSVAPGGTYTYLWSNGATTQDLINLVAGNYSVTVSMGLTCSATSVFAVGENSNAPQPAPSTTAATCGLSNGAVNLALNGGAAPFTFLWSNGVTTQNLSGLSAGNYAVTVTGADGCSATEAVLVDNQNPAIALDGLSAPNTACNGGNGSLDLSASPAGAYTFLWSNGATTEDLSNLVAGNYAVTVTAGLTCSATSTFTVANNSSAPNLSAAATPTSCGLSNGAVNISLNGGATPYAFSWSNGATTEDLSNLATGNYSVTVTGADGCTATQSAVVDNQNPPITLNALSTPNTACNGGNGSLDLSASPAGAYTFLWSNGATTEDLSNLVAGNYAVTVTTGLTCSATSAFTVDNNSSAPGLSAAATPATCGLSNGSAEVSLNGGVAPFTFLWSNGATTQNLAGVASGNYAMTVTAADGCTATTSAVVDNQNSTIAVSALSAPNTVCNGGNGSLDLSASPAGAYTFLWSNGATTEDLSNLAAGDYSVTVTAGLTCSATSAFTVDNNSSAPSLSAAATSTTCGLSNGSVDVSLNGGAAPFTFLWSNGATTQNLDGVAVGNYALTVTAADGCTATTSAVVDNQNSTIAVSALSAPNTVCNGGNGSLDLSASPAGAYAFLWSNGATTEDLSNLAAGDYSVTVTSGLTCSTTAAYTVQDNSSTPNLTVSTTASTCGQTDGAADVALSGGAAPFTFLWSNGATTQSLSNVAAGAYDVTVTSADGCSATASASVGNNDVTITAAAVSTANSLCQSGNGSLDMSVSPAGNYAISWSNGATTEDLSGLPAGTYSVTVTSGSTCSTTAIFTVDDNSSNPVLSTTPSPATCGESNGAVDVALGNGGAPYTYLWSNGATTLSLSSVPAGAYSVTVTAADGCTAIASAVVQDSLMPISLDALAAPNTACTGGNGGLDLSVLSAGAYTIAWSNGAASEDLSGLVAGDYTVTVTTGLTCTATATFTIDNNSSAPGLAALAVPDTCGKGVGAVDLSVEGGTAPFTFLWSNGATTEDLDGLAAGPYSLIVTGADGCSATTSLQVGEDSPVLDLAVVTNSGTACSGNDGSIDLSVSPAGAYAFLWSNGATTEDISGLPGGHYSVTVMTLSGCMASTSVELQTQATVVSVSGATTPVACFGGQDGRIELSVSGGHAPYAYDWSPVQPGNPQNPGGLVAGQYAVTVTDASGCSGQASFSIGQPASALTIACAATAQASGPAANDGQGSVTAGGGTAPYTLNWNGSAVPMSGQIFMLDSLPVGTYAVTVTDQQGCPAECGFSISSQPGTACLTTVGKMGFGVLTRCGADCATADYDTTGQFLDAGDMLQFVLHQGNGTQVSGELGRSAEPNFCFDPATMSFGTTYYISAVVGLADGSGNVFLGDGCAKVAAGTPLIFYEKPLASATGDSLTCGKEEAALTGASSLAGSTFAWSVVSGGNILDNPSQPAVQVDAGGTYAFVVQRSGCADTVLLEVPDLRHEPAATVELDLPTCHGDRDGAIHLQADPAFAPYLVSMNGIVQGGSTNMAGLPGGNYHLEVLDHLGCAWETDVVLPDPAPLSISLGADLAANYGETLLLQANVSVPASALDAVLWTPDTMFHCPQSLCLEQEITATVPTEIGITVIDTNGCQAQDRLSLRVRRHLHVYIPNVFTPDEDGENDVFTVFANEEVEEVRELRVFDRWGENVFHAEHFSPNDWHFGWNGMFEGKPMNPAVFVYWTVVRFKDGSEELFDGDVTLLR